MENITLLGLTAGALCTASFIPQVLKIYKSKSAKDISLVMFVVFSIGIILWMLYGIYNNDVAIIFANMVTLLLSLFIIAMKVKYK